ncbi:MAG TPA: cytochrome c [Terriglobia bacterium]|nr:cytochrome c [Terriglobia bacterium]
MGNFKRFTLAECQAKARRFAIGCFIAVAIATAVVLILDRFPPDRPVDYQSDRDHFFYGSIGSDISGGLPLKVIQVLPEMFPEYLPKGSTRRDYTAFGFIQQPGAKMPIGFSIRRQIIDLTSINCAACHTGTVRETAQSQPTIIPAMPANTLDLHAFFRFLFACAADERFNTKNILAAMDRAGLRAPVEDLIYRIAIPRMKQGLNERARKIHLFFQPGYPLFGPGRVNTFDSFKYDQFASYYKAHGQPISPDEVYGTVDFPSVWNEAAREGMHLHWDGNNTSVRERNFSAAIGAGAAPPTVDVERLFRIEAWLDRLPAPAYPFAINAELAQQGETVYRKMCFGCHDLKGNQVGRVIPLEMIGTDRRRLDSYTQFLLEAQKDYTKGYFWAFTHFSKTHGYATQPLDGIWARAPYLHGGSVPNMWDLLTPAHKRPKVFTRGSDVYDQENLGFVTEELTGSAQSGYTRLDGTPYTGTGFVFDTSLPGNSNQGHTGPAYGTELSDREKRALIEYFKWQDRPRG